jgi:hypothetical protein
MLGPKTVLVVGTGTIGEPLLGLLCNFKAQLGIDEVLFHKRTPLLSDRSKVQDLQRRGARLVTDSDRVDGSRRWDCRSRSRPKRRSRPRALSSTARRAAMR